MFAQLVLAVDHIHSHRTLHRDIKPEVGNKGAIITSFPCEVLVCRTSWWWRTAMRWALRWNSPTSVLRASSWTMTSRLLPIVEPTYHLSSVLSQAVIQTIAQTFGYSALCCWAWQHYWNLVVSRVKNREQGEEKLFKYVELNCRFCFGNWWFL